MHRLRCAVQNYEWGKPGTNSIVAKLTQLNDLACSGSTVSMSEADLAKPFAEFWMGTHKNAPSYISKDDQQKLLLADFIAKNQATLGETITRKFGGQPAGHSTEAVQLPFLFKVLSVNKALSIQIHPDKPNARELRKQFPNLYPDDNHKPEMAVAVGEFECMCGFRPASEISHFLNTVPELRMLIGDEHCNKFCEAASKATDQDAVRSTLGGCFNALMNVQQDVLTQALGAYLTRIRGKGEKATDEEALVDRLYGLYGNDVGCWSVYFLNVLRLKDGEAVFLGANVPHCYLFGDCVELMACSDNVVRAGLTPKYRDVATLCRLVDCTPSDPASVRFAFTESRNGPLERRNFVPPVDDFALDRYRVSRSALGEGDVEVAAVQSAALILVLNGDCVFEAADSHLHVTTLFVHAGTVVFVPAHTTLKVKHKSNVEAHRSQPDNDAFWQLDRDSVVFYRAYCAD